MVRIPSLALAAFLVAGSAAAPALAGPAPEADAVIGTYAQIGQAAFEDALLAGKSVKAAVDAFLADPTVVTALATRKQARADARTAYKLALKNAKDAFFAATGHNPVRLRLHLPRV